MNVLTPWAWAKRLAGACDRAGSYIADLLLPGSHGRALQPVRVRSDDVVLPRQRVSPGACLSTRIRGRCAP